MSLKAVYKTESEIPEGLREHYKELADGTFKINLEGELKTQEDVDRAMAAMEKQKNLRIEAERMLSGIPDDFDVEKWSKVKSIDPDNLPTSGNIDSSDEKEFNRKVAEKVREKERELEEEYNNLKEDSESIYKEKEQKLLDRYKNDWVKSKLAEKYGFTDMDRLRWFMFDTEKGEHPDIKRALESIEVQAVDGDYRVIGGELKDADGAIEVLEKITTKDVIKKYKPASDNSGGGTHIVNGSHKGENKLKKEDGTLNITVAGKMYRENQEKARSAVRQAGFDPDKVFSE